MPQLTTDIIRLRLDVDQKSAPQDANTSSTPVVWRSSDVAFQLGIFYAAAVVDVSNLTSVTLEIKTAGAGTTAADPTASPLASKTVTSFDNTLDAATWTAGTKQHVAVAFSAEEMNFALGGTETQWLVISALTAAGKTITLAAGLIQVKEDGYNSAGTAPTIAGTAYTKAESLALFGLTYNTITARTGGGATALDGLATASDAIATGVSVRTRSGTSGAREEWILTAGTDAENAAAGIVRPDDYNASTNARVWKQIL